MRLTGLTGSAAKNLPKDFPYDAFPDAARRCCLTGVTIPGANESGAESVDRGSASPRTARTAHERSGGWPGARAVT